MRRKRLITDRLSHLPDDILLRVLSFLPTTRDVLSTMVLSKRWKFLWKMVPKLVFDNSRQKVKYRKFSRFVDRSLFLHKAPVLETLHLDFGKKCNAQKCRSGDVPLWIRDAATRNVRELIIKIDTKERKSVTLPRILYTSYKTLVTLKLSNAVLVNVPTSSISFPTLKELSLVCMKYPSDEFFDSLISSCPVLEDLVVKQCLNDNVTVLSVRALHLQSLALSTKLNRDIYYPHGFVINAPSLEYLRIDDYNDGYCIIESDTSKIVEAILDMTLEHADQLLGSMTSAKYLYLSLEPSKEMYPVGSVFNRLVDLKLRTWNTGWLDLLMCLLRDSPNLQYLSLEGHHKSKEVPSSWNEPSFVPECVLSSLEDLIWTDYVGTEDEIELVEFLLEKGNCLKYVIINTESNIPGSQKLEIIKDLSLSPRASPACHLAFDFD